MRFGKLLTGVVGAMLQVPAQARAQEHPAMSSLIPSADIMTRAMHAGFGGLVK